MTKRLAKCSFPSVCYFWGSAVVQHTCHSGASPAKAFGGVCATTGKESEGGILRSQMELNSSLIVRVNTTVIIKGNPDRACAHCSVLVFKFLKMLNMTKNEKENPQQPDPKQSYKVKLELSSKSSCAMTLPQQTASRGCTCSAFTPCTASTLSVRQCFHLRLLWQKNKKQANRRNAVLPKDRNTVQISSSNLPACSLIEIHY